MHCITKCLLLLVLISLGQKAALGSEIIHGDKAQRNTLLYMASVQDGGEHVCGGFLISKDFVVTAAHCDREDLSVVLGTHNIKNVNEKAMRYNVRKCKHTSFKNILSGNDIMLLKLSKKAKLSKSLKTIKLPRKGKIIKANTKCLVAGWGLTEKHVKSVDLREANVSTIDLKLCKQQWDQVKLPDNVICAGGYNTDKGFCKGDSGGPLVCNGKAVGIVSFYGKNCVYPNVPNVYTEISKFLPWINKILKKKTCENLSYNNKELF